MSEESTLELMETQILGESSGEIKLNRIEEFAWSALRLARQAQRSLEVFSFDLDPQLYDQSNFIEAVQQLALRSPKSRVRVLIQDNDRIQREGHRLIELFRRLRSRIEIRIVHADYVDHPENFLLADRTGFLHRRLPDRYQGDAGFNNPRRCDLLGRFFDEVWEKSEPDSELRALHI